MTVVRRLSGQSPLLSKQTRRGRRADAGAGDEKLFLKCLCLLVAKQADAPPAQAAGSGGARTATTIAALDHRHWRRDR